MSKYPYKFIFDLESVANITEHRRYQAMERFVPSPNATDSGRRGLRGEQDPLTTPRWPFQEIVCAVVMQCVEHTDGGLEPINVTTLSRPDHDESEVLAGLFDILASVPADSAELVTWGGTNHDIPLLLARSMRHGLTLPRGWEKLAFGGNAPANHLDLLRVLTANNKMRLVHMAEVAAMLDIPAKLHAHASRIARYAGANDWSAVKGMCEVDVTTTALIFATWQKLLGGRQSLATVQDRIYRLMERMREDRAYIPEFTARRRKLFVENIEAAEQHI
jgi:predicted PolB exonuclease-like 3'-5' exonuclease